ncbi:UNVERIFIED_CONTAM: hypothetical protein FKN15_023646 [Acipenser sinensis]
MEDFPHQEIEIVVVVQDKGSPQLNAKATFKCILYESLDILFQPTPTASSQPTLDVSMIIIISLGAICAVLLVIMVIFATRCNREKKDTRSYNCRVAESTYQNHPKKPSRQIHKGDITLVPTVNGTLPIRSHHRSPSSSPTMERGQMSSRQSHHSRQSLNSLVTISSNHIPENFSLELAHTTQPVEQVSQLLSMLHQGQYQPRPSFRGNKYSRSYRYALQDMDKFSLKDSGRGDSEAGDSDYDLGRDSPIDRLLGEGFSDLFLTDGHHRLHPVFIFENGNTYKRVNLELAHTTQPVEQVSQLLSMLHQGQYQPRPSFRGNKYSRSYRYALQDMDKFSLKDSGRGDSEAGDSDYDLGRDSPIDRLLGEGFSDLFLTDGHHRLHPAMKFCTDECRVLGHSDQCWMPPLPSPASSDYRSNMFIPGEDPQQPPVEEDSQSTDSNDKKKSFSTFGKDSNSSNEEAGDLCSTSLLSEMNSVFQRLLPPSLDSYTECNEVERMSSLERKKGHLPGKSLAYPQGVAAWAANTHFQNPGSTMKFCTDECRVLGHSDQCWMPPLPSPASSDYRSNMFIPGEDPQQPPVEEDSQSTDSNDKKKSFSTFGKDSNSSNEEAGDLCSTSLLSEMNSVFQRLLPPSLDSYTECNEVERISSLERKKGHLPGKSLSYPQGVAAWAANTHFQNPGSSTGPIQVNHVSAQPPSKWLPAMEEIPENYEEDDFDNVLNQLQVSRSDSRHEIMDASELVAEINKLLQDVRQS